MTSDSDAFIPGPFPIVGGNASQAEVEQLMRDNLLPPDKYQPGFTPMIINTGKQLVIFDTGNGAKGFVPRPAGGWLATQLGRFRHHARADRRRGAVARPSRSRRRRDGERQAAVPQRALRHRRHRIRLLVAGRKIHRRGGEARRRCSAPTSCRWPSKITFLKPGDDVVPGIRAREAYGHTPGHLAFDIESDGKRMLFWGDCAHHQVASLARPDWHCSFDVDKEQGAKTRRRIYELAAAERIPVSGYHMPFPSIGYVERLDGGGYRWLAHTYLSSSDTCRKKLCLRRSSREL